jgi:hypothetical protein
MEHEMDKMFTLTLAVAVCLATTAMLAASRDGMAQGRSADAQMATDGPFRDGLFVGRLAAEGGRPDVPQIGRWSKTGDRASFLAGYQQGYGDVLAGATAASTGRQQ